MILLPPSTRRGRVAETGAGGASTGRVRTRADYLAAQVARRSQEPLQDDLEGGDLLGALLAVRDEGDRLSQDELISMAFVSRTPASWRSAVDLIRREKQVGFSPHRVEVDLRQAVQGAVASDHDRLATRTRRRMPQCRGCLRR
jgi:hypothetical protein